MISQKVLKLPAVYIFRKDLYMARIIEGNRRIIKMSVDDVLNIVREYQQITKNSCCYEHTRELLEKTVFFIPEDI